MKNKFKLIFSFIVILSMILVFSYAVRADDRGGFPAATGILGGNVHSVFENLDNGFYPNKSILENKNAETISFNELFGSSKDDIMYRGEIPNECYEANKDKLSNVRRDSKSRGTWHNPNAGCSPADQENDLHIKILMNDANSNTLFRIPWNNR